MTFVNMTAFRAEKQPARTEIFRIVRLVSLYIFLVDFVIFITC